MKKKLLVIMMATMMLSVTACTQNTPKGNDSASEESSDTTSTDNNENSGNDVDSQGTSNGSNTEVDYDTTGMDSYTDKDGNIYYYDRSCVPDWWEEKVEVIDVSGLKVLTTVVEDPDYVYLFSDTEGTRVVDNEERYKNGEDVFYDYSVKRYVPEGWRIDYDKSTAGYKFLKNDDLDVYIEFHRHGITDHDMYWFSENDMKVCWNKYELIDGERQEVKLYEAPDYVDYTVQTYEEYKGYEPGTFSSGKGGPFVFVRTYSDGRVYYDCFGYDNSSKGIMLSITEEDAIKMQNAGVYTDIYNQAGAYGLGEVECDFATFSYMYLSKNKYFAPDDKNYWKN